MNITLIELNGLRCAVQADSTQPNHGGYILKGHQAAVLPPFRSQRFFRHGFHSWSLASWLLFDQPLPKPVVLEFYPHMDALPLLADYPFLSSGVSALEGPDGQTLLLGALGLDARVRASESLLSGTFHDEEIPSAPHEWFLAYGAEGEVFQQYMDLLGERLGRRGIGRAPRVWCSWYSLWRDIDEATLLGILSGVKGMPFEVFQIDDGWQISLGDWDANPAFPSGMPYLAERIQEAGFTPGLWMAPFIVQPTSSIFRNHPDWLLHDERGQLVSAGHNWGDHFYAVDTTHPEVQAWLAALVDKVRGWGFRYLKLDFLYAAALPAVRTQNLPPEAAYRMGLEVVRQAMGEDYLLVCGSPVIPSLGLADGMRIGPDVAPFWDNPERSEILHDPTGPSTLNAMRTSLHRLWLSAGLHPDPDVVFFRSRYNLLRPDDRQALQLLAQVAGFRATSDPPQWLSPEEHQALEAFLETKPTITRLGRYRYQVDEREIDFGPFIGSRDPA